jgi:hypothetical protein
MELIEFKRVNMCKGLALRFVVLNRFRSLLMAQTQQPSGLTAKLLLKIHEGTGKIYSRSPGVSQLKVHIAHSIT